MSSVDFLIWSNRLVSREGADLDLIEMIPVCWWEPFPAQIPRGGKLLEMVLFLIQYFCLSRNEQVVLGDPWPFSPGKGEDSVVISAFNFRQNLKMLGLRMLEHPGEQYFSLEGPLC